MCLRPVKMFNQTNTYRSSDRCGLIVPCGECEECRAARKSDYEFRIYEEMLKCSRAGYNLYFVTLTYNEANLPRVKFRYNEVVCFRRSDVTKFAERLRKYLLQKYDVKAISYVFASEFGSHTQRPHYHGNIAVPKYGILKHLSIEEKKKGLKIGDTVELTSELIHSLVRKFWISEGIFGSQSSLGFIFPRYYDGGVDSTGYVHKPFQINPEDISKACLYTAKYCCKDLTFYGLPSVQAFEKYLKDNISDTTLSDAERLEFKRLRREHMSFVVTSKNFGSSIDDLVISASDLVNGVKSTLYDKKNAQIPMYNKRRLLYHVRTVAEDSTVKILDHYDKIEDKFLGRKYVIEKPIYKYKCKTDLTELGKEYRRLLLNNRISKVFNDLNLYLEKVVTTKEYREWYFDRNGRYPDFKGIKEKLYDISVYSNVYRWCCSPRHVQCLLDTPDYFVERTSYPTFVNKFHPITHQIIQRVGIQTDEKLVTKFIDSDVKLTWTDSSVVQFSGREDLNSMTQKYMSFFNSNLTFDRYKYENEGLAKRLCGEAKVHFNDFPCFAGFDEFLDDYTAYTIIQRTRDAKARAGVQAQKDYYKQVLTENVY